GHVLSPLEFAPTAGLPPGDELSPLEFAPAAGLPPGDELSPLEFAPTRRAASRFGRTFQRQRLKTAPDLVGRAGSRARAHLYIRSSPCSRCSNADSSRARSVSP